MTEIEQNKRLTDFADTKPAVISIAAVMRKISSQGLKRKKQKTAPDAAQNLL